MALLNMKHQSGQGNVLNYFIIVFVISFVMVSMQLIPIVVARINVTIYSSTIGNILLWVTTFIAVISSFGVSYYLIKPFDKNFQLKKSSIPIAFSFSFLTVICIMAFDLFFANQSYSELVTKYILPLGLFVGLVVIIYTYFTKINFQKQTYAVEIETLKKENIIGQYEALKNELSPHFLFNSLNSLQAIIGEDQAAAKEYVYHLSSVLRNTLQSNERRFVTLQEEMTLITSYLYLLEMRYGSNLRIETSVPEIYKKRKVLPLTLQLLLENAVKHNEISKLNPLLVKIFVDDRDFLVITNNIQGKIIPESSLGIGLSNLTRRYNLVSDKGVSISKEQNQFRVEIPLIAD